MNATEVYAILKKKIEAAATGIESIEKDGHDIVFKMSDGREFRIEDDAGRDITDIDIDEDRYIVVTFDNDTTVKSDVPLPLPDIMVGSTDSAAGKAGLVPVPPKGSTGFLNAQGEWDDDIVTKVDDLETEVTTLNEAVPTSEIPEGSTLTSDGWAVTTDSEVADEFAKWIEG